MRLLGAFFMCWLGSACAFAAADNDSPFREYSEREFTAAKSGLVVDAMGRPLQGVTIIAEWSEHGTYSSNCNYHLLRTTDDRGQYTLPDVSKQIDESRGGSHRLSIAHIERRLQVAFYKPGWIEVNDAKYLNDRLYRGQAIDWHARLLSSFGALTINEARMTDEAIPFNQTVAYLRDLSRLISCEAAQRDQSYRALTESIVGRLPTLVCAQPPDETVSGETAWSFTQLMPSRKAFYSAMREQGEPEDYPWHATKAGVLCAALKNGK